MAVQSGQQGQSCRNPGQVRQAESEDSADAYDFYLTKLKLFGIDGDVSDAVYEKMADGLADIGIMKKPYPPKSAIFDGSFVKAAASH